MLIFGNKDLEGASLDLARLIETRFKNIQQASKQTRFTRSTIYSWIEKGSIPDTSKELLKARGFDPETLERLGNGKKRG